MRAHTEEQRAAVWIGLQANNGNVARTSRETGVPKATIRDWKRKWDDEPPTFEAAVLDVAHSDFVERAEAVRDKLLVIYEKAVDAGEVKADKLPIHIGILDDKVRLHRGLATSRSESTVALPKPEEVRELFSGLIRGAIEAAVARDQDIIDVELVEQADYKALTPASQEK
jgi:hypothetical protein